MGKAWVAKGSCLCKCSVLPTSSRYAYYHGGIGQTLRDHLDVHVRGCFRPLDALKLAEQPAPHHDRRNEK